MLTEKDFLERFSKYSDKELFEIQSRISDYSPEAQAAFHKILNERGGIEKMMQHINTEKSIKAEFERIKSDTLKFVKDGADHDFIKKFTSSSILNEQQLNQAIEEAYKSAVDYTKDTQINNRTITGSLLGGLLASIIGGILFGIQLIFTARIFYILLAGLFLLSYFIIKASTRQSKSNVLVLVASVISAGLAFVIGYLLYSVIGYHG